MEKQYYMDCLEKYDNQLKEKQSELSDLKNKMSVGLSEREPFFAIESFSKKIKSIEIEISEIQSNVSWAKNHLLKYERIEKEVKRLSLDEWKNIFRNLQEMDESDYYDGVVDWVEIMWLDSTDEYVLCYGEELFEDGFKTEKEAQERLSLLEQTLL